MSNENFVKSKRDHVTILLFLFLFPLVLLIIDITTQNVPGNYQSLYNNPIWIEGKTISQSSFPSDPITDGSKYLADYLFLSNIKDGYSLLWDHTSGGGTPFLARWSSRPFSLFSLPFYFLPFLWALYSSIWLKMVIAGIGIYFLTVSLGLLPSTGLLIAIIFQSSGPLFYTPIHPLTDVIAWFPLYFLILHNVIYRSTRFWIVLSFIIAVMELGGDISTIIVIFIFTVLYILAIFGLSKPTAQSFFSIASFVFLAWIVANGFIAFQLLPFFEWCTQRAKCTPIYSSIKWVFGDLFGLFLPKAIKQKDSQIISYLLLCTPGICCILFLPLWVSSRSLIEKGVRGKIEALFFVSLCMFILLFLLQYAQTSIYNIVNISLIHVGWLVIFSTAFIIGLAVESWNLFSPDDCRICAKKLLIIAPTFWLLLFLFIGIGKGVQFIGTENFWYEFGIGLLFLLIIFLYLLISLFSPSPRNAGFIVALFFILSLALLYFPYRHKTPVALFKPNNEIIAQLEQQGYRFASIEDKTYTIFPPSNLVIMTLPEEKCTNRYQIFMKQALKEPKLWMRAGTSCFLYMPALKYDIPDFLTNVRPEIKLTQVFSSGLAVFKIDSNMKRAYVIYNGKNINDINPELLKPDLPHLVENAVIPESGAVPETPVTIENASPTRIQIKSEKTKPGILVLADTFYPGWKVNVDGVAKEMIPINIAFRGVELSEGDHQIEFIYSCQWLWWGCSITIVTFVFALIVLRFSFRFSTTT